MSYNITILYSFLNYVIYPDIRYEFTIYFTVTYSKIMILTMGNKRTLHIRLIIKFVITKLLVSAQNNPMRELRACLIHIQCITLRAYLNYASIDVILEITLKYFFLA